MQEQGKKMALVRSLLAGITAGVLAGSALGVVFVFANRYLADGQPQLALASLRDFVNRYALRVGLFFLQIEITYLLLAYALGRRWKGARAAHGANAVLWIFAGSRPSSSGACGSPPGRRGCSRARGSPCSAAWRSWGSARAGSSRGTGSGCGARVSVALRGLGGAKPAGAALVLLAGVNAGAAALASHRDPHAGPTSC